MFMTKIFQEISSQEDLINDLGSQSEIPRKILNLRIHLGDKITRVIDELTMQGS